VRKMGFVLEDATWTTVHPNPDNCTCVQLLEERLLDLDSAKIIYKEELVHARALVSTLLNTDQTKQIT
jgi:hypothetical protein